MTMQIFKEVRRLIGREDAIILDVGSNDGSDTNRFLARFPRGSVYSFEPDPRAIARWRKNVVSDRAVLFECALGAVDGEAEFHMSSGEERGAAADGGLPAEHDSSGSLRAPKTHLKRWPWVKFEKKINVQVRTLDSWAAEQKIERVDFIWADVQGAEGDFIAGAGATLRKSRYFYTEYSNDEWYEGQITLDKISELLGPEFVMLERWRMDALFINQALNRPDVA